MLKLKPGCECCDKDLPPDATDAMICTFECTFCRDCVDTRLNGVCPNCGGNFSPRPIRPAHMLQKFPATTERTFKPEGCGRRLIENLTFYLVAIPVLMLTGISKGGFGSGVGIVAVPSLSLVIPPLQAVAIMLPILCLMDVFGVWSYRRQWSRTLMLYLAPGAVIGIGIATALADFVDEHMIRLIVGSIAVLFALNYWLGRQATKPARSEHKGRGIFWSAISGFTSFVGHAGGPPLQVYLLPLKLDKTVFVGTTTVFFMAVNYVKLVPYGYLGLLTQENLLTALVLAPMCPIAMLSGVWLHHRIPERPFYIVCYVFVFLVGCKLLYDGVTGMAQAAS